MTRQQRRRLEREKKKDNSISIKCFGMYYKNDSEDGFSLVLGDYMGEKQKNIMESMIWMYDQCKDWYSDTMRVITKDELEELKDFVLSNLEKSISYWNSYQNITTRDVGLHRHTFDFTDRGFIENLFQIMTGIYFSVQQGLIENDNHNGFLFGSSYKELEKSVSQFI